MEKPFEINYEGFTPSEAQRVLFQQKIEELENKFGRIIAGRISVKAPSEHHRTGRAYEITIRLRLPAGKEVDVSKVRHADERHAKFQYAVNDAFKRAHRQLQDHARKLEGLVKAHEPPPVGVVTKLFADHGFLETAEGLEIYFHMNSVLGGSFASLEAGSKVTFHEEQGEQGPQASTVKPLEKHGLK